MTWALNVGQKGSRGRGWTKREIAYLRKHVVSRPYSEIAKELGRPINGVQLKTQRMGLKYSNTKRAWTRKESSYLRQNLPVKNYAVMAKKLGRSVGAVTIRVKFLRMKSPNKRKVWTDEEIKLFKTLIKIKTHAETSKILNRSVIALMRKATGLGIKRNLVKDISGKKFGRITAIKFLYVNEKYNAVWHCECDCGKALKLPNVNFTSGNTTSCGCRKFDNQYLSIENRAYSQHLLGAKARGYISHLSRDEYIAIAKKACVYCGELSVRKNRATGVFIKLNSVDRRNNESHYKLSNSQSICFTHQTMKSDMTHDEFIKAIFFVQKGHTKILKRSSGPRVCSF